MYNNSGIRVQLKTAASHKLLSVIIPAYNVENFLAKCVGSILNQTYKNIEIIIVNDGSTDGTPKICDELANKYNNIKIIHQENQGSNIARLNGFNASSGDYIAFIDSDDYIDLDAYAKAVKALDEDDCDMVMFGHYFVDDDGKIISKWSWPPLYLDNPRDVFLYFARTQRPTWGIPFKVYKRGLLENIDWPKMTMFEDYYISEQIFAKAQKFMTLSEPFYYYVQRQASVSHQNYLNKAKLDDALLAQNLAVKFAEQNMPEFLPDILWRKLIFIQEIFMDYAYLSSKDDKEQQAISAQLQQIIKQDYARMNDELRKQGSDIKSRPGVDGLTCTYALKYRMRMALFIHYPRLAALLLKIKRLIAG